MKVLILVSMSGPDVSLRKGRVYDLPDSKALQLLNAKLASPVRQEREESVIIPVEKAVTDVQTHNSTVKRTAKPSGSKRPSKGNRK